MRRRKFIQAIATLPVATMPLFGQIRQANIRGPVVGQTPLEGQSAPVLKTVPSEAAATPIPVFFTKVQFSTLCRLCDLFLPPFDNKPGALDSGAAEFLDFYVGVSNPSHQQFYKTGLDGLEAHAKSKFGRAFARLGTMDADLIVKPMFKPRGPIQGSLELGPFVNRAYQDISTVTLNSPAWAENMKSAGLRPIAPLYWEKVDPTVLLVANATPIR